LTRDEIARNVLLIVEHAEYVERPYRLSGPDDLAQPYAAMLSLQPKPAYVWEGSRPTLCIEQVDVLRALNQRCQTADERTALISSILSPRTFFFFPEQDAQCAQVMAHALIELGAFDRLDEARFAEDPKWTAWGIFWQAVRVKLSFEPGWFPDSGLGPLLETVARMAKLLPKGPPPLPGISWQPVVQEAKHVDARLDAIKSTVSRVSYLRLRNMLQVGYLPEVDADRRLLLSRLQALGFSTELEAAVVEVDRQIHASAKGLDLKRCMELLRTVLERVTERAAEEAAAKKGTPLAPSPTGPRRFSECNNKLVSVGLLTTQEAEVNQKLGNYLAVAGSHALTSAPEQVRVCRTTVIEWSLLIAGRLQQFG
jgi:hypothetical protein